MSIGGVTKWDRLELVYPQLHQSARGRSPAVNALRCNARIEPFEVALRAIEDRGSDATTKRLVSALALDYAARVSHWSRRSPQVKQHPGGAGVLIGAAGLIAPLVVVAAKVNNGPLSGLAWWQVALIGAPIALPCAYLGLVSLLHLFVADIAPEVALAERRCGDCGIPLDTTPPGLPETVVGVNVGPRSCPACERPWPLVPPPVEAIDMSERSRAA